MKTKKITVLTGSARRYGNSNKMAEAFIKEAEALGHTVTRFDTALMKIGGCRGCEGCYKTGKPCLFDDDFNKIAPVIVESDAIVFVSPVYFYSLSGQLKSTLDRFFAFSVGNVSLKVREIAIISCCEEKELKVFDGVKLVLEETAAYRDWRITGEVLIPGVYEAGAIDKTDGCAQAAALAHRF